jgi:hypothetical protein
MKRWLSGFAVAAVLAFGALPLMGKAAHAEPGVFDDRLVFGPPHSRFYLVVAFMQSWTVASSSCDCCSRGPAGRT